MKYKHIVWDWNGTILNDTEACSKAISEILEKRNLGSISVDEYRAKLSFPAINLYYESGLDFGKESFEDISEEYIRNYIKHFGIIDLHEDAKTVLESFRRRNINQHIVSASGNDVLYKQIEMYNLRQYFSHILGQENNRGDSKAHLARKLLGYINCNPENVLFIGDTVHDYEVAKEVGFDCCLVSNGHNSRERLEVTGAPVYNNLTDLYKSLNFN